LRESIFDNQSPEALAKGDLPVVVADEDERPLANNDKSLPPGITCWTVFGCIAASPVRRC